MLRMEKFTPEELMRYEELEKKHLGDFEKNTGIYHQESETKEGC
jgi:hypothetical protein